MNILITGASSGLGLQLAQDYLCDKHQVYVCGRTIEKLTTHFQSQDAHLLAFDTRNLSQTNTALTSVDSLDLLILNAGTCRYVDDPMHFEPSLFPEVFSTNLLGTVNVLTACLPKMKSGAQIIFIGSAASRLPLPRAEAYGASKAALDYLVQTLQITLASKGIACSLVQPGFIDTPLTQKNDFPMPWLISVCDASKKIRMGIQSRRRLIRFPWSLHFCLTILSLLPQPLWRFLARQFLNRT